MKIAIIAPSGNIGRPLTARLLDAGTEVTLLARTPAKVKDFEERGARVLEGSLADQAFVTEATGGSDALFWLTPPDFASTDHRAYQKRLGENAAAAIKANSISRVVNLSSTGAQLPTGAGPVSGLHHVENLLNAVARNITHLRPGFFMENFLGQLDSIKNMGSVFMPVSGDFRTPMIATRDIAEAAAKRLLDRSWTGRTVLALHGPADLSLNEAAATLSEAIEMPVAHVKVTPVEAREALLGMGASPNVADEMVELYTSWDQGLFKPAEHRTGETTTPTTLAEFASEVLRPMLKAASVS
jgi:uncharacterized protein YbjT (DUF2867 family)